MRLAIWMCALGASVLTFGCGGSETGADESTSRATSGHEIALHDKPSREELAEVLGEQAAHIRECGAGGGETVRVEIVFEGASGRVVELDMPEEVARSTKICIQSNLVNAAVAPFTQERFNVVYPFTLRGSASGATTEPDDD